jgi:hypothetical protein
MVLDRPAAAEPVVAPVNDNYTVKHRGREQTSLGCIPAKTAYGIHTKYQHSSQRPDATQFLLASHLMLYQSTAPNVLDISTILADQKWPLDPSAI